MADSTSVTNSKLIYVMPRIRISGTALSENDFHVSKAHFLPDESKSWDDVIRLPRSKWLDIYKQFPRSLDSLPDPARGTLIISSDEVWLIHQP